MTDLTDRITATVEGYFAAFNDLDAAAVADLYAPTGEVEDPLGTPLKRGREEILAFYEKSMAARAQLERTGPIRINNAEAAFPFRARVNLPEGRLEIDVIDTMTFDEDGKILKMRAFFGETNTRVISSE